MSAEENVAVGMIEAFCACVEEGIAAAAESDNHRVARHQINVASRMTLEVTRAAVNQGLEEAAGQRIRAVVAAGRLASGKISRICQECDDLYRHEPPDTTEETCTYCTAERQYEEGA